MNEINLNKNVFDIRANYKIAIIPKDTLLFRRFHDNKIHPLMFFGFDEFSTSSNKENLKNDLQVWTTKKTIISTFLIVDGVFGSPNYYNELQFLYFIFSNEEKYYLDIKHYKNPQRLDFINFLKENNIDSWVTYTEGNKKHLMELFLFTNINKDFVKFKKYISSKSNPVLFDKNTTDKIIFLDFKDLCKTSV